jgi:hypothetical protein
MVLFWNDTTENNNSLVTMKPVHCAQKIKIKNNWTKIAVG